MDSEAQKSLLTADDPPPVRVTNRGGSSLFLLLGDHAGNLVPARLAALGLPPEEFNRHIAQDIGIAELGSSLAQKLDAPFVEQRYSRLVVDCNRSKGFRDSIARVSDGTIIPRNDQLKPEAANQRYADIFEPYHSEIAHVIDERFSSGRSTVLVSLHSFTPILDGKARPWDIGVLYDGGDTRYARAVLAELERAGGWHIGDNVPYQMDETDFTIPHHAYAEAVPYVELEIRQDLLAKSESIARMSEHLARAIVGSAATIEFH